MEKITETPNYVEYSITQADIDFGRVDAYIDLQHLLVLSGACKSRAEAKRLITQGAVEIDGLVEDVRGDVPIRNGAILKVGKRFWGKIRIYNEKSGRCKNPYHY